MGDMLYKKLADKTNLKIASLKSLRAGEMRHSKGDCIETIFNIFIRTTWVKALECDSRRLIISPIKIPYNCKPNNDTLTYSQIVRHHNKKGRKGGIGLDSCVYIDGRLVMASESKSYCDISMYKRAQGDFESVVAMTPRTNLVVFQAENALGGEIHKKTVCNIVTDQNMLSEELIEYLENRNRICRVSPRPTVLTLTPRVRSPKKDISKMETPVTEQRVKECVDFIAQTLGAYA
jgi:hypothetical protein